MQDQQTVPPTDEERTYPEFDRRRGPRRAGPSGEVDASFERRQGDRRKRKPGIAGLFGAIFGHPRPEEEKAEV
jgi:hypothetical protein